MPQRISRLKTYFSSDRIDRVFWISTLFSGIRLATAVAAFALGKIPDQHIITAITLTTLVGLAALEHWVMILPFRESALWQWATNNQPRRAPVVGRMNRVE